MIFNAMQTTLSSIGMVYDAREFRAVQLVRTRSGDKLHASAIFPRYSEDHQGKMPDAEELRWVRSMLSRQGFEGNSVSILPSPEWCSSQVVELPPVGDPAAKAQIARVEVAREKKCAPTDFEVGLWDLPMKGRSCETMVVSCQRSGLNMDLNQFENSGMEPVAVDLPEQAVVRAIADDQGDGAIVGVLHIGWDDSLAVIEINGAVVYVRRIERGLKSIHDRLCAQYGLKFQSAMHLVERMQQGLLEEYERPVRGIWTSLVRALVEDLDVAIRYVSHAYRSAELGSIFLSGYGAVNHEFLEEIDAVLGMPVQTLIPSQLRECSIPDDQCARLAIAVGLAARFDQL